MAIIESKIETEIIKTKLLYVEGNATLISNNLSIVKNNDQIVISFDIIGFFKKYSPVDTLLWLNVISIHPNNQLYLYRVEILIGMLLTIPESEFANDKLTREDIEFLFNSIDNDFTELFFYHEDFEGFNQNKLIPLFFEGEEYYIYYGSLERPIEFYQRTYETYFEQNKSDGLITFRNLFFDSLNFQTRLLKEVAAIEERNVTQESPYIPTVDFFNRTAPHFYTTSDDINDNINIGDFEDIDGQQILENIFTGELFQTIRIKYHDTIIFITPQNHYPILSANGAKALKSDLSIRKAVYKGFQKRLLNTCFEFFTFPQYIPELYLTQGGENILNDNIDFCTIVDSNKLFLFKAVKHHLHDDISIALKRTLDTLLNIKSQIIQRDFIGILDVTDSSVYGIPAQQLEIWCFPVFESVRFNYYAGLPGDIDTSTIYPIDISDLTSIFMFIEKPFDFLKFLREDDALKKRLQTPFTGEFMNRFAFYLKNDKSYLMSGREINFIVFDPHWWHEFILETLYNKYSDETIRYIKRKFASYFTTIEKYKENVYRMANRVTLDAAYLVVWKKRKVWIYSVPNGYKLTLREISTCHDLLMMLFADYLNRFEEQFSKILEQVPILGYVDYALLVFPKSYVVQEAQLDFLHPTLSKLSTDTPLVVDTRRYQGNIIKSIIVFDADLMVDMFSSQENIGERFSLKILVQSILLFAEVDNTDSASSDFIENTLPLGMKSYSIELLSMSNPALDDYGRATKVNPTDIGIVNRLIAEHLIKNSYAPGDYTGKEAQSLNYDVYCFLQSHFEDKIVEYNATILIQAYIQLETLRGEAHKDKLKMGTQAKGRVDFDIVEEQKKRDEEVSRMSAIIGHILHTIIKVAPNGNKHPTKEDWTYLLAIGQLLIDTAMIYDYIHYDLRQHTLQITNEYLLKDIVGDEVIDSVRYVTDRAKDNVEYAKWIHDKAIAEPEVPVFDDVEIPDDVKLVDDAFLKQFGFEYIDLLFFLNALHSLALQSDHYFPLTVRPKEYIATKVLEIDRKSTSIDTVLRIIDFLTLETGIYKKNDLLIPSNLMRNKERINVCPIIKLDEKNVMYGNELAMVAFNFWSKIEKGDSPYAFEKNTPVNDVIKLIHKKIDLKLELDAEKYAVESLGNECVEARIENFKRLSSKFNRRESCGEIDLLCVNKNTKKVL